MKKVAIETYPKDDKFRKQNKSFTIAPKLINLPEDDTNLSVKLCTEHSVII